MLQQKECRGLPYSSLVNSWGKSNFYDSHPRRQQVQERVWAITSTFAVLIYVDRTCMGLETHKKILLKQGPAAGESLKARSTLNQGPAAGESRREKYQCVSNVCVENVRASPP